MGLALLVTPCLRLSDLLWVGTVVHKDNEDDALWGRSGATA